MIKTFVETEISAFLNEIGGIEKNYGKISKMIEKNLDKITARVMKRVSETKSSDSSLKQLQR